jgi:hypothetical protein
MMWIDYNIESSPDGSFAVMGEWFGEVMGLDKEGNPTGREPLYKPGDVFIVNKNGWLVKQEDVSAMMMKYEASRIKDEM